VTVAGPAAALPISQLRDYYDALAALKEQEQTALAKAHAEDPKLLAYRFGLGIKKWEDQPAIDEPFYGPGGHDPPNPPTPVEKIVYTHDFASQLASGAPQIVKGDEKLSFTYVDREISPARTKGPKETRIARRSLDLLLANDHDRTPVLAELKIRDDKLAYFALVQVLMLAVELLSSPQRERLATHTPVGRITWPGEGPFADLYIIAFDPPASGTYRQESFEATEQISKALLEYDEVSRYIRRIAYLEASPADGGLKFERRFAFGSGL